LGARREKVALLLQEREIDHVADSAAKRIWDVLNYRVRDKASILSVLLALLIILLTVLISRYIRAFLQKKLLVKVEDPGIQYTLLRITHYIVLACGALFALRVGFEVDLTSLAVAFGFLSVGIGFGLQYIASDMVSGFVLLFERPIRIGDRIKVGDVEGKVQYINLRTTILVTNDNLAVIFPNSQLIRNQFINYSYGSPEVRITVSVGVAYDSDVEKVKQALMEAALSVDDILKLPAPEVRLRAFGESALNLDLLAWINQPHNHQLIKTKLNAAIFQIFSERKIEMPFPQQELRLRAGWEALAGASSTPVTDGGQADKTSENAHRAHEN
jgi:small-conductance mechanosensitive channel